MPGATKRIVTVEWWWVGEQFRNGDPVITLWDSDVVLSTVFEHATTDTAPRLTLVIERTVAR